jgi:hypothetical protein
VRPLSPLAIRSSTPLCCLANTEIGSEGRAVRSRVRTSSAASHCWAALARADRAPRLLSDQVCASRTTAVAVARVVFSRSNLNRYPSLARTPLPCRSTRLQPRRPRHTLNTMPAGRHQDRADQRAVPRTRSGQDNRGPACRTNDGTRTPLGWSHVRRNGQCGRRRSSCRPAVDECPRGAAYRWARTQRPSPVVSAQHRG